VQLIDSALDMVLYPTNMESQPSLTHLKTLADYDPNSLPVEQARQFIRQFLTPVTEQESARLHEALGRTLARDVLSPVNVPPHDNSAMDGYAVRCAGPGTSPNKFRVIGSAYAGHPFTGYLAAGECVRIMTGAPIPEGCDSVVMQEHVEVDGDQITLARDLRPGQNIRRTGEDIQQDCVVLRRGQLVRPAGMGLLASLGLGEVKVYRRLRVALFSTGDELQQPGRPLADGQIYDSNRYSLLGLLQELGAEILDRGSIPDDPASLRTALLDAAVRADVIITTGGVSVGEADHIKQLLAEIGEVVFWKIAMKPGRPLAYGKIGNCHFFGLPGNPVAVMVTFLQFVREALRILMGQAPQPAFTFQAICTTPIRKLPGRTEFQRGILTQDEHGKMTVRTTGEQGSGILSSMSKANCFIVLPPEQGNVEAGSRVLVQLLHTF
jgi:molybdopterin molybdotransferase